jgi:hypothetical protein
MAQCAPADHPAKPDRHQFRAAPERGGHGTPGKLRRHPTWGRPHLLRTHSIGLDQRGDQARGLTAGRNHQLARPATAERDRPPRGGRATSPFAAARPLRESTRRDELGKEQSASTHCLDQSRPGHHAGMIGKQENYNVLAAVITIRCHCCMTLDDTIAATIRRFTENSGRSAAWTSSGTTLLGARSWSVSVRRRISAQCSNPTYRGLFCLARGVGTCILTPPHQHHGPISIRSSEL